ncbi:thiosulfate transmembrane transporter [Aureococcus anophagefferens]|nr:thiosulfate transmembrane transporter [Aureococcus anophagefferens]
MMMKRTVCLLFVATATAQLGSGIDWRYYTTQDGQPVPGLPDGRRVGGPRLEPADLFSPAARVATNPSVETYGNASSPKLRGYRGADVAWRQNPSNHSAECLANGGVWNKFFDGVGDSPPVLRVRWSANCSIPFHYHPTGAIYWILYGRMYFVGDCGTDCTDRAVGRGEIRWVRPGFNYGPEHNDYDAPCEITVLGVDTNPTFEHAPAPYRVQKRVLVDYIYGPGGLVTKTMGGREDSLAWQLGLAGLAGFVAQGTVHGIETTMVRQQLASKPLHMVATARAIVGAEGVASLYRGFAAAGLRELSYTSLRFGLYEPLKKALGAEDPRTAPFHKKSSRASARRARAVAGGPARPWPLNFYRGVSATVLRACCLGATKMACYDQVKEELRRRCGLRDDVPSGATRPGRRGVAAARDHGGDVAGDERARALDGERAGHLPPPRPRPGPHRGHAGPGGLFRGFSAQWAPGPRAVHYAWEQMRLLAGMRPL